MFVNAVLTCVGAEKRSLKRRRERDRARRAAPTTERKGTLGEQVGDSARQETSSIYPNVSVELDNRVQATIIILYWTVIRDASILLEKKRKNRSAKAMSKMLAK